MIRIHESVRAAVEGGGLKQPRSWKDRIPWYIKILVKIPLSRLPIPRTAWQRVGGMDNERYAHAVLDNHLAVAGIDSLQGMGVLELGPGNGLLSSHYALQRGASHIWMVDAAKLASQIELPPGSTYLTEGLESLRTLPGESIDFLFSEAVLEHVRLRDFEATAREMRRLLKPGAICSHSIDFRDHLQEGLNNLRFSEKVWESGFMSSSGFYTNRLTLKQMLSAFQESGFLIQRTIVLPWPAGLPTQQSRMAEPFRRMPVEDLMPMRAHVICTAV